MPASAVADAYDAYGGELFGVAARTLRDRHRAEDAVHEVFVRAHRSWSTFDPARGSLRGWLHAILRNHLVDLLRADGTRPWLVTTDDEELPVGGVFADDVVRSHEVAEWLARLPDQLRGPLTAIHYAGETAVSFGDARDLPAATVRGRVQRALVALRDQLEETDRHG